MINRVIFYVFLFCSVISICDADVYEAYVVRIIDGDTIEVLTVGNKKNRIRLAQIDAPERHQPFGNKARQFLARLVFNLNIVVEEDGHDKYGRTLAVLYVDNLNVNQEMVKYGMAWAYRDYVKDHKFIVLEEMAKTQKIGLWSSKDVPIAPWIYRRNKR